MPGRCFPSVCRELLGFLEKTSPLSIKGGIDTLPSHLFQPQFWSAELSTVSRTSSMAASTREEHSYPRHSGLAARAASYGSEDDERLLLTASPNLSTVKQEVTYTHAPPDLTLRQNGPSSKRSSWQASLSACDYCHGPGQAQKSELQMPCHPQPA